MSPLPDEAVLAGMLRLKQRLLDAHFWVIAAEVVDTWSRISFRVITEIVPITKRDGSCYFRGLHNDVLLRWRGIGGKGARAQQGGLRVGHEQANP